MIFRVLGVLLGVAAIAAAWVLLDRRELMRSIEPEAPKAAARAPVPGYSARHAEIVETGRDGRPMYIVRAETIQQDPAEQSVTLATVRMEMIDQTGQRWTARSDYGQIYQGQSTVQLTGDVLVSGTFKGSKDPAEIATDRLWFDTVANIVKTTSPVTLNWAGRRMQSNGLSANLKDQSLKLESSVHGLFTP
jgi:LPS export ABC transporter protein LptC